MDKLVFAFFVVLAIVCAVFYTSRECCQEKDCIDPTQCDSWPVFLQHPPDPDQNPPEARRGAIGVSELTFRFINEEPRVSRTIAPGGKLRYSGSSTCRVCERRYSFSNAQYGALWSCYDCFDRMTHAERRQFSQGLLRFWESERIPITTFARRELDSYYNQPYAGRSGRWRCQRCQNIMVGSQVHSVWIGSTEGGIAGEPLTFLCESCWGQTTEQEREGFCARWLALMNVPPDKRAKLMAQYKAARFRETEQ